MITIEGKDFMTVRDLIKRLLDENLNGQVTIQYPTTENVKLEAGETCNYSAYKEAENFEIVQCSYGIILGVENDNK